MRPAPQDTRPGEQGAEDGGRETSGGSAPPARSAGRLGRWEEGAHCCAPGSWGDEARLGRRPLGGCEWPCAVTCPVPGRASGWRLVLPMRVPGQPFSYQENAENDVVTSGRKRPCVWKASLPPASWPLSLAHRVFPQRRWRPCTTATTCCRTAPTAWRPPRRASTWPPTTAPCRPGWPCPVPAEWRPPPRRPPGPRRHHPQPRRRRVVGRPPPPPSPQGAPRPAGPGSRGPFPEHPRPPGPPVAGSVPRAGPGVRSGWGGGGCRVRRVWARPERWEQSPRGPHRQPRPRPRPTWRLRWAVWGKTGGRERGRRPRAADGSDPRGRWQAGVTGQGGGRPGPCVVAPRCGRGAPLFLARRGRRRGRRLGRGPPET